MSKGLGIDIGVSFIKICLLSERGISNIKRVESPSSKPSTDGKHETDPRLFLSVIKKLIDEYLNIEPNIQGIYISTQMHGFVLVDKKSNPCFNYISWKDRRSEFFHLDGVSALDWIRENVPDDVLMKTGMGLRSGLPSVNLFVLQRQDKIKTSMSFGTIGDFVVANLTNTAISTSLSNAAGTGLFDIENNNWNSSIIDRLGITLNLPLLRKKTNMPIGLYKEIKVFPAIGDQQASLLGLEVDLSDAAVSNIATGSQATITSSEIALNKSFQTRPYVNNTYLYTIPFIPAGRVLNSLVYFIQDVHDNFFGREVSTSKVWSILKKFTNELDVEKDYPSSLQVNTDLIGSFSLDGGEIRRITENNFTISDIILAFVSNIVENHINSLGVLRKCKKINKIILSGGVSKNLPIIERIFKLRIQESVESSLVEEDALNGLRVLHITDVKSW